MVNGVSSYGRNAANLCKAATVTYVQSKNDVENLIKFNSGLPVELTPEPTIADTAKSMLPIMGIVGTFQGISTWKNNGLTGTALEEFDKLRKEGKAKGWNFAEAIKNVKATVPYTTRSEALKAGKDIIQSNLGNIFKTNLPVAPSTSKIGRLLEKIPGYTKFKATGINEAIKKSNSGLMVALQALSETFTQVVPAFKIGTTEGFKQIGKSAVNIASYTAGWVLGDTAGKALGATIGTAICPGIGTAIGTWVGGFLGGIIGSAITTKATKAITGKSEVEKHQEEQIAQAVQQVEADPNTKIALAQQSLKQAEQILAQDPSNKDALKAKASAQAILAETGAQAQVETQATNSNDQAVANQQQTTQMQQSFGNTVFNQFGIPVVPGFNGYSYDMNILNQAMSSATAPNYNMNFGQMTNPFMPQYPQMNLNQPQIAQ